MTKTLKLYKVTLRGFGGFTTGVDYKSSFVVARDATEAYEVIRTKLDAADYGFPYDREMEAVELIAEDDDYTSTKTRLLLPNNSDDPRPKGVGSTSEF